MVFSPLFVFERFDAGLIALFFVTSWVYCFDQVVYRESVVQVLIDVFLARSLWSHPGPMPNITLVRAHLFEAIGKQYTDAEFDELCFEFGVEVDDVETQVVEFTVDGQHIKEEHVVYVIAIPANRYDLLCMEGFARAIRVFIGKEAPPVSLHELTFALLSQQIVPRVVKSGLLTR